MTGPITLTLSFDTCGLDSVLAELKSRPQAAGTVIQMIKSGRHRELFTLASDRDSDHLVFKLVPTDLLRCILSAHDC